MLEEETNEEVEEIRELLYNLLKDYPAGVTSQFLEEQYHKRYVEKGLTKPLPKNWLSYAKQADEFKVKQLNTFTMLYLVNAESENLIKLDEKNLSLKEIEITSIDDKEQLKELQSKNTITNINDLEPMPLISMPFGVPVQAHIVLANDPDHIHIRLYSWDPLPDYLYSALARVKDTQRRFPSEISINQILAANISNKWERVKIVKKSENFSDYYVVYAVDVGFYDIISKYNLRPLSSAVEAFKKIFLARIKLSGIIPPTEKITFPSDAKWSREAQLFLANQLKDNLNIKIIAKSEWCYDKDLNIPCAEAELNIDGKDMATLMVSEKLAQQKC